MSRHLLLDANVLIALFDADHVHHFHVREWFLHRCKAFATCPIVEGALVRWIVRIEGQNGFAAAARELEKLAADPRHVFWPDQVPYAQVRRDGVFGHKQVTDAYLAQLARQFDGGIATMDRALAELHEDVAQWLGGQNR